ncbi:glycosyltransferase family protein [Alteromonas sp. CI.11.F.A3]|uniref:MJ1255/VC2487 family glycosyltransferase n=1 Tax=Alteromonas sp. CI.11.F.A3 TaxID=3079555 RepID=UPI0029431BF8|nr:MJ1255/VC2487 family glycosyltransferase [Alteromonas sp. CI.11.F.A3]WOI37369.1 glycosyltransferase family protein [Alteromonas sp. CI.11.F.A3]
MKLLYGVQGTGNGHIARARIMAAALAKRSDVEVDFVFTGREPDKYFDMDVFGDYRTFTGLSFITKSGRVDRWQTVKEANISQFLKDVKRFDASGYDLLVNDFEPVTAWAAKRQHIPSISISHQAAFSYDVPKSGDTIIDRLLMKKFAPTDLQLGVHWFHFNQPIIPPFVAEKPVSVPGKGHVLVYLPFEDVSDVQQMLEPLSDQQFQCFHPDISEIKDAGHIQWNPTSKQHFQRALQHCNGVIANGGFELSSEALQLGKKLLIKPLHGQFEQLSNVLTLNKLDLCHTLFQLDTDIVEEWLEAVDIEAIQFPDNPDVLIDWLKKGDLQDTQSLCNSLWKEVRYGDKTQERLLSLAF